MNRSPTTSHSTIHCIIHQSVGIPTFIFIPKLCRQLPRSLYNIGKQTILPDSLAILLVYPFHRPIRRNHYQRQPLIISLCYCRTIIQRSSTGSTGQSNRLTRMLCHPQRHKSSTPLIQHNIMLHSLLSGKSNQQRSIPGTRRKYNPLYPFPYQYLYQYPHSVFI